MVTSFDLNGKVILITGGYGYLGTAISESLVHHGAKVYVLGRSRDKFQTAFTTLIESGKNIKFIECDIASSASIQSAFENVAQLESGIDVLINNAFFLQGQDPFSMTDDQWAKGIDGSLNSVFRAIREVLPYMRKSGGGRIINVSSMYGIVAPDFSVYDEHKSMLNPPHYGAAKAGIIQMTKYYASLLGKEGITVNTVSPGPFPSTKVQEQIGFIQKLSERTCLGRIGKPEELAGIFIYLASDASSFTTGQNFVIDGGWTTR